MSVLAARHDDDDDDDDVGKTVENLFSWNVGLDKGPVQMLIFKAVSKLDSNFGGLILHALSFMTLVVIIYLPIEYAGSLAAPSFHLQPVLGISREKKNLLQKTLPNSDVYGTTGWVFCWCICVCRGDGGEVSSVSAGLFFWEGRTEGRKIRWYLGREEGIGDRHKP